jgi:hypothetical protein
MNLLLIDDTIQALSIFINSCNDNTKYVVYNYSDTLEIIKRKIEDLNISSFNKLAFVFSSGSDINNKLFVIDQSFITYDPSNNIITDNEVTFFIKYLVDVYSVEYIDFLACNLLSYPIWKSYFDYIKSDNSVSSNVNGIDVIVRASNDLTGNLSSGGDWVLETTNEDVSSLYFNENIEYWNYLLDNNSSITTSLSVLTLDTSNNLYTAGDNTTGELGRIFSRKFSNEYSLPNDISKLKYSIYNKKVIEIVSSYDLTCFALLTDETSNNLYVYGPINSSSNGQLGMDVYSKIPTISSTDEYTGWFTNVRYETTTYLIPNKKIISVAINGLYILALSDENINNLYSIGAPATAAGFSNPRIFNNISLGNLLNKKIISVSTTNAGAIITSALLTNELSNNLYILGEPKRTGYSSTSGSTTNVAYFTNKNINNEYLIPNKKIISVSLTVDSTIALTDEVTNNIYTVGSDSQGCTLRGIITATFTTGYTNLRNSGLPIISKKVIEISAFNTSILVLTNESTNNVYIGGRIFGVIYNALTNINITATSLSNIGFISYGSSVISYYNLNNTNTLNNLNYQGYTYFGASKYLNSDNYNIYYSILGSYTGPSVINTGSVSTTNNINGLSNKIINKIKTFSDNKLTFALTTETSNNFYICGVDNMITNKRNGYIDCIGLNTRTFSNKNITNLENKNIIKSFNTSLKSIAITNETSNNLYLAGALKNAGIDTSLDILSGFNNKGLPGSSVENGIMLNKKVIDAKTSAYDQTTGYQNTLLITNESSNNLYISSDSTIINGINSNKFINKRLDNNEPFIPNKKIIQICSIYERFDTTNGPTQACSVLTNESSNNLYFAGVLSPGLFGYNNTISVTLSNFTNLQASGIPIMEGKKIIKSITSQSRTFCITDEAINNLYVSGYNTSLGALGVGNTNNFNYTFTKPYSLQRYSNNTFFSDKKIIDVYTSSEATICLSNESSNNAYVTGRIYKTFLGLTNTSANSYFVPLTQIATTLSSPLLPYIINKKITNLQLFVNSYINYILDFRQNNKNMILGRVNTSSTNFLTKTAGYLGYNMELNYNASRHTPNIPFTTDISANMTQPFIDRSVYHNFQVSKIGFTNLNFTDNNAIYTPVPTDAISLINNTITSNVYGITNVNKYFTLGPIETYAIDHLSFDISVEQNKNIQIYSKNYNNVITFISSTNTSQNNIYYTHSVSTGLVTIYSRYFSTIIIKTLSLPPTVSVSNTNAISSVSDVSFNTTNNEITYPDSQSESSNTITVTSTTPTNNYSFVSNKIRGYFQLYPQNTSLTNHLFFNTSVTPKRAIDVYYLSNGTPQLISKTNDTNNNYYYTYNNITGSVSVKAKNLQNIFIIEKLPLIDISNNSSVNVNVSNVNIPQTSSVTYNTDNDVSNNTIRVTSTTPSNSYGLEKLKTYISLYPPNTTFTEHISFDLSLNTYKPVDIYFKSQSDGSPILIPSTNTPANDVYYTYNSSTGLAKVYTKHFSEVFVSESTPSTQTVNNNASATLSSFAIPSNQSVTYSSASDVSANIITLTSSSSANAFGINKQLAHVNATPYNTTFTQFNTYNLSITPYKSISVYFKQASDPSASLITSGNNNSSSLVYYTYVSSTGVLTVNSKISGSVIVSEVNVSTQTVNNNASATLSSFAIPSNQSVTYSSASDVSANTITLTSSSSANAFGINKQLALVNMEPSNVSLTGNHMSYNITLTPKFKPINVYYKESNDISYNLLSALDTSTNNIYYTYNPTSGEISVNTNKSVNLIVSEATPVISLTNNNSNSTLSFFTYNNSNTLIYPNNQTTFSNIITANSVSLSSSTLYNLQNIKSRVILEPSGAQFTSHVSYQVSVTPTISSNQTKIYFKSGNDIIPQEIPSSNTSSNDVYYQYTSSSGLVTIYTKHFSESIVTQEPSNNVVDSSNNQQGGGSSSGGQSSGEGGNINFYIPNFNYIITMGTTGILDAQIPDSVTTDAIADFYVNTQHMRNVFIFQTDSDDIDTASNTDIKYFVRMSEWPTGLVINPVHAYVSTNPIANATNRGAILSKRLLVKHDFIRYLAKELFNTHLGVDLFLNEDVLKYDLAWKGHNTMWNDIKASLHNVDTVDLSTNLFSPSMYGTDQTYGKYLTNDASGNNNLCKKLINQIVSVSPSRFQNLNNIAIDASNGYYSVPFMNNDSISFTLVLNPAQNQHLVVNRSTPIGPRTYKIRINIRDTVVNSFSNSDSANVIVDDTPPSYYMGQPVTNNLNTSYPANYTV